MRTAVVLVGTNSTGTGRVAIERLAQQGIVAVLLCADPSRHDGDVGAGAIVIGLPSIDDVNGVVHAVHALTADYTITGVTTFSDPRVAVAAQVAHRLGLPGGNACALDAVGDKWRQYLALADASIRVADSRLLLRVADLPPALAELGTPVVVKPRRGSGSVGVRLADSLAAAERAVEEILNGGTSADGALLQAYIDGPQFSAELFDGVVVGLTRNYIGPPPTFVEIGHDYPAVVDADSAADLSATAAAAVSTLSVGWGASHVELRLDARRPCVIEVNSRLAGGMIPELVHLATGIDLVDAALARATGQAVALLPTRARAAVLRAITGSGAGVLAALDVPDTRDDAVRFRAVRQVGDAVGFGDFRDRVGYVIAAAAEVGAARELAEQYARRIAVTVAPRVERQS